MLVQLCKRTMVNTKNMCSQTKAAGLTKKQWFKLGYSAHECFDNWEVLMGDVYEPCL